MMTKDEFKECIRCFLFGGRLNRRLHLYIAADDFSRFVWYEQPGDRRAPSHADLRFGYENEEPAEEEEEEVVDSINGEQLVYATIYTPLSTREGRKRNFLDIANFKNLLSGFVCQFAQGTGHRQLVLVMCRSPNVLPKTMTGWRVLHQPLLIWSDEIQASASFFALGLQGGGTFVARNTLEKEHCVKLLSIAEICLAHDGIDSQNEWRKVLVRDPSGVGDEAKDAALRDQEAVNKSVFALLQKVKTFVEGAVQGGQCQAAPQPRARELLDEFQLFARFLGFGSPDVLASTLFRLILCDHVQHPSSHAGGVIDLFVGERDDIVCVFGFINLSKTLIHTTKCGDISSRARTAGGVESCSRIHALSQWTQVSHNHNSQPRNHTTTQPPGTAAT